MNTTQQAGISLALGQDAPSIIQLIPYGEQKSAQGSFTCNEESIRNILEKDKTHKNDYVIDYEHQSLGKDKAPAAGWITELIDKKQDGLWGKVSWTKQGKEHVKAKEYRYVSPVFLVNKKSKLITEFINLALTNSPQIDGMVPLINKQKNTILQEEHMNQIAQALGLNGSATLEEILATIKELIAQKSKEAEEEKKEGTNDNENAEASVNKKVRAALNLDSTSTLAEITSEIFALKKSGLEYQKKAEELEVLKKELAKQTAEGAVTTAMKSGKLSPAQKEWAMRYATEDPEGFKMFVAKASPILPFHEIEAYQPDEKKERLQDEIFEALGIKQKRA